MASKLEYEIRTDGILFYLRDGVSALVAPRSTVRHRVELWKHEKLLPPDVGDISNASFLKRLAKAAAETFGEVPYLEEDLGRVAVVSEKKIECEDGGEDDGKTLGNLLKGTTGPSITQVLIRYGSEAELFHDPDGEPYVTFLVGGHYETWPLKSRQFKSFLRHRYYTAKKEGGEDEGSAPPAQALTDALAQLEAKCQFEGSEHLVHVRVAEKEGSIYLDLADDEWRTIKVTQDDWQVVSNPPVKFRRARGMASLPMPTKAATRAGYATSSTTTTKTSGACSWRG